MSNYLAVATVTAALAQIVQTAAQKAVGGATVEVGRPNASTNSGVLHKIHLYLYQVSPNAALRNADLPTRSNQGNLAQRPQVALDLHYLLAFYGDEKTLEPERMLGAVVRDLHARPLLDRKAIQEVIDNNSNLTGSDLADAIESVKFTPLSLSLDELSKLWSVFFQTPHALSVVYQGTVVLIEAEETPAAALPVREPGVYGMPFAAPVIERVKAEEVPAPQSGPRWPEQPINLDSTLIIEGKHLRGDDTVVLLDGTEVASQNVQVADTRISIALATLTLRAGAHSLQVVHRMQLGTGQLHRITQSNVIAFLLRPIIQVPPNAADSLAISFTPAVGRTQRVTLLLYEITDRDDPPPRSYLIEAPTDNGITDEKQKETVSITFPIAAVQDGSYLVRAQVDGAESILKMDANGKYSQPKVTKP